jgi:oligopeptide/dipeptide ABC transporter ATP-binding protein
MPEAVVRAVDNVDVEIRQGETVALVGESGSGKSTIALSIMKLVSHPGRIIDGRILYKGQDLIRLSDDEMIKTRTSEISMVFQDPMSYLNPVLRVGDQIAEAITAHQSLTRNQAHERVIDLLRMVRIPEPDKVYANYPHQLSGGMRQRVLIAMALSCNPSLLIADEPTTALDVTVQRQILRLIQDLKNKINISLFLITHDLGIVAGVADTVYVMYCGEIIEKGDLLSIYDEPKHPYTKGLLESTLSIGTFKENLVAMKGSIPDMINPPPACRFHPRCPYAMEICNQRKPTFIKVGEQHHVSCWLYNS